MSSERADRDALMRARGGGAERRNPHELSSRAGAAGPEELASALRDALRNRRPAVIHAKIDPAALSTLRKDLFKPVR